MRKVWGWPVVLSALVAGCFFVVDFGFFCANLLKITDGGWLPLTFGAIVFFIMATWRSGTDAVRASLTGRTEDPELFMRDLETGKIPRVPGTAVFLTRTAQRIPPLLIDHVKHMGALHQNIIALTVQFEETPRVADEARSSVVLIADNIWRVTVHFGFVEIPDLCTALKHIRGLDPSVDLDNAIYFAARDLVVRRPGSSFLAYWRLPLFAFLYRNALKVVDRFNLPAENVVEIARQIEI
jgi:KUP system potassium uptake protein